jgi:Ferritin-like domain
MDAGVATIALRVEIKTLGHDFREISLKCNIAYGSEHLVATAHCLEIANCSRWYLHCHDARVKPSPQPGWLQSWIRRVHPKNAEKHQRMKDNNAEGVAPEDMLAELRADNQKLTRDLRSAHELCEKHDDATTASLLENWIDETERWPWVMSETVGPRA